MQFPHGRPVFFSPANGPLFSACLKGAMSFISLDPRIKDITLITAVQGDFLKDLPIKVNKIISTSEKDGLFPRKTKLNDVAQSMLSSLYNHNPNPTSLNIIFDHYDARQPSTELSHAADALNRVQKNLGIHGEDGLDVVKRSYQLSMILINSLLRYDPKIQINVWIDDGLQWKYPWLRSKLDVGQIKYYFYHKLGSTDVDVVTQHGEEYLYRYVPWMQYDYLMKQAPTIFRSVKDQTFILGMTHHVRSHRTRARFLKNVMPELNEAGYDVRAESFLVDASWSAPMLPYKDYMERVERSCYTAILPSMDPTVFSLRRFIESTIRGCVPLIHEECAWRDGLNHDRDLCEFAERWLVFKEDDLKEKLRYLEDNSYLHETILSMITSSKLFQSLTDESTYTNALAKVKF